MAAITQFYLVDEVARMLGEDPEMLEAIVSNDDNLSYGNIVSVLTGTDEAITAVTGDGVEELHEVILDARRSPQRMAELPRRLRVRPGHHCSCQGQRTAVATERLRSI